MRWILGCLIGFAFIVGIYLHFFEREEVERFRYGLGDMVNYQYELADTRTPNDLPMERVFTAAKQQLKAEADPAPAFDPRSVHRYEDNQEPWLLRQVLPETVEADEVEVAVEVNVRQLRDALRGGLLSVALPTLGLDQVLIVRQLGREDGVRAITLVSQPGQPLAERAEIVLRIGNGVLEGELQWWQQRWQLQTGPDGSFLSRSESLSLSESADL